MYKPRYYQEDAISATFRYINNGGKNGLMCLPTGGGKSLVVAEIVKRIMMKRPHVRIMVLSHVKEIIEQNYEKLTSIWPTVPSGIYSAGIGFKQFSHPVIYGGVQSCYRKPQLFGHIDLLLVDEAHLISDKGDSMYGFMIAELRKKNPDMIVIGLTATSYRLGMGCLTNGPIFDDIYYDVTKMEDFVRFIEEGYLSDLTTKFTDTQIDLSAVKMNGQEFQEKSLDENVNRDQITKEIVLETINKTKDRNKGLAFCVSKSHAENMARRFSEAGYSSTFIHSDLSKSERENVLEQYSQGNFKVLCNVGCLTTGFDAPDVDFIVLSRPTQSTGLHVQMVGRGLRVHPSKTNTLILDFAQNTVRLGPINDPVIPVPKGQVGGEAPIRICEACLTINHAAARVCKECGMEFPPPEVKFSSNVSDVEVIRRKDIPKFSEFDVQAISINPHVSMKGNNTCKISFVTGGGIFDTYFIFDKSNKTAYNGSIRRLEKFKFSEERKNFQTTEEGLTFLREYLIKPDKIKVWMNKPIPNKTKREKEIMEYIYE